MRRRPRRRWPLLAAPLAGGLLLAACSGGPQNAASAPAADPSATPGGTTSPAAASALAQAMEFTACMRSHGVPDFPEPTDTNGQISFDGPPGLGRTPDFQSAQQTCSLSVYGTTPIQGSQSG